MSVPRSATDPELAPELGNARQYAPATQRNRSAILAVLQQVLPAQGLVLEIAAGTGEHAVFFAPQLVPRQWLPSDTNPVALASIAAWRQDFPSPNLYAPIALDAVANPWTIEQPALRQQWSEIGIDVTQLNAIVNINMIHISPWRVCEGLMAGAGRVLPSGGVLYLYGPFKQHGQHTAASNEYFDESLRNQNPEWGVRDVEAVVDLAATQGLKLVDILAMPANNLSLIWQKI
jgi:Protein of unknown function (DUF938)